jgi:hypothetical protein
MLDDRPQRSPEAIREALSALVGRLEAEAKSRVSKRSAIEARWIEDLEHYHGRYDQRTLEKLAEVGGSRIFVNITRPKTNAMSARLMDLLFPTDDENWSIAPTPAPQMTKEAEEAAVAASTLREKAQAAASPEEQQAAVAELTVAERAAEALNARLEEARRRADLMKAEIADQLEQCSYYAQCRDMIDQACKIGTGVIEGPVANDGIGRTWAEATDEAGAPILDEKGKPAFALRRGGRNAPAFHAIDAWSFYPDPDARSVEDSDDFYVRYLWRKRALKQFAKTPGVDADAVRDVLRGAPTQPAPDYLSRIRSFEGRSMTATNDLYHVWKFTGALDAADMQLLAEAMGDAGTLADVAEMDDPLAEMRVVLWFCQGRVLKFAIYPLDSEEPLYSVFNLEKDEASIWGYGIPRVLRAEQEAHNGAWRMLMDNAGESVSDVLLINKSAIEPDDGSWQRRPRKTYFLKDNTPTTTRAMEAFSTNAHVAELTTIIDLVRRQADEGSSLPTIMQGDQGATVTKTAQGMALLMNNANVMFRRVVKNFDDDVTVPNIRRLYDWNMQFSEKAEIKGDYEVVARGSSVLLVRELQAQNMMGIALQFGGHPVYGKFQKDVAVLREVYRAHMLNHAEFVMSDAEAEEAMALEREAMEAAAAAGGATGPDPEIEARKLDLKEAEIEANVEMANMEADMRLRVAEINRETAMMQLAEKMNMQAEQIEAMLTKNREAIRAKERSVAAEVAIRRQPSAPLNETQIANE